MAMTPVQEKITARVRHLKRLAALTSEIYVVAETEMIEQLRKRQLAANPRGRSPARSDRGAKS